MPIVRTEAGPGRDNFNTVQWIDRDMAMLSKKSFRPPSRKSSPYFEDLEPRILFSAEAASALAWLDSSHTTTDNPLLVSHWNTSIEANAQAGTLSGSATGPGIELVFIDSRVTDQEQLIQLLTQQNGSNRSLEIHQLVDGSSGIDQISQALQGRQGISAIHIVSHGDDGQILIGNTTLDQQSLPEHAAALAEWSGALSSDADLLLYGCDVAATEQGVRFLDTLSLLTGADVAASADTTGSAAWGGNWRLEYTSGTVDIAEFGVNNDLAAWSHILPTVTLREGLSGYAGTADTYLYTTTGIGQNTSQGSNTVLASGPDGTGGDAHLLLKFDLSSIPTGSVITSASLTLQMTTSPIFTSPTYTLHRMLVSWGESSTWVTMTDGISLGSEARNASDGSFNDGGTGSYTINSNSNLVGTIQAWVDGTVSNQGWYLDNDVSYQGRTQFASSENATLGNRPTLSITYTAPTPPTMDLDANNSSGAAGNDYNGAFVENSSAVNIADTSDATITAGDSGTLTGMSVTISNLLNGTAESLSANTAGTSISASYDSNTGELSLTGNDTVAHYQQVLRTITYNNTSDTPNTTPRSLSIIVQDSNAQTASATSTISVASTNDAPTISSNGAGSSASVSINENLTAVTTVVAADPEGSGITYSIVAGDDGGFFSIGAGTGVLTFSSAPDRENPLDANADNVYVVTVRASDGSLSDTQIISVTVDDVSNILTVNTATDNNDTGMGSSFTVEQLNANKGTDGKVSLREAIIAANTTSGTDTIEFDMTSGAGVYGEYTITVGSALPNLTGTVVMDGTTQTGYSTLPLIVLDGNGGSGDGLYLSNTADGSTIKGLLIRDFSANGIYVQSGSDNNIITGNLIGSFNADGSNAGAGESNLSEGIESYGANLTVGGSTSADRNVISGNGSAYNIYLGNGSSGSTVQGNYLGTNAAGTSVFSSTNSAYGVMIESASTNITIGGDAQGEGNLISGFTTHGIWVTTSGNTTIQGNYIGTDYTGNVDLGNTQYGIYLDDTGNATIGGTTAYAGNLISGNNAGGIRAMNSGTVTVLGNIIGLDIDGTTALANSGPGIYLNTGAASTIGGNGSSSRNTISGNTGHGIEVRSNDHVIKGNYIGVGINGSTLIGNGQAGIYIAASDVTVGGKTTGDGNVIAGNGAGGIVVASGNGNLFYQNSIHSNTGLGIDLGNDGLTSNDDNDGDGGANWQNNFPVITSVVTTGASTTITGSIDWYTQAQPVYIEFFSDSSADASGHGEGRTYLGYVQVTTEATTGDASFSLTLTGVSVGEWVTAVANVEGGAIGASEFALSVQAVAAANAPRGRVIWNVNDRFNPYYANWSTSGFSGTGTTGINFTDDMSMILAAESPTRDEILFVGAADVSGKILAGIWNGSTWSSTLALPVADPGVTAADYNSFAVAYDSVTGDAMLVWDNGTSGSSGLSYATWDGSSWSAIQTITAPVSGNVTHIRMAASSVGSEMTLVAHTDQASSNQFAMVWNGSSWGNGQLLGTNDNEQYYEINVAYEQLSGRSMVFYEGSDTDSPDVYYRIWNGSSWSAQSIISAPGGIGASSDLYSTAVASDPNSNRIAIAAKNATEEVWLAVWDGSTWGSKQVATTSGNELVHDHPTMSLAFEGQSGDLIAAYGKASGPAVYFRTWSAGGGWSVEQTGPSVGGTDIPYIVKLYADPYSDTVMLGVQDNASDLHFTAWDGTAWGTVTQLDASTGFTYRENFVYVWNISVPTISDLGGDVLAYTEDQGAVVLDQGNNATVQVNGSDLGSGNLTVSFAAGSTSAEDALSIRHQGNGAGQVGVSGGNVSYEGTLIGTYTGGTLGAALVVSLNSNATATAVGALVRNITYENTNNSNPSTSSRTIRFAVTDALGTTSANIDTTVTVASANDAPVITSNGGSTTANVSINENTTTVTTVTYNDPDGTTGLAFSISGGADSALFSINASGVLSFNSAPDAETPLSSNGNNQYVVTVRVSDGSANDTQTLTVTVSDVDEFNVGSVSDVNATTNTVAENAANGSQVGITASATDADISNSTISYSLSDDAGGRFTINSATGVVTVADGSLLNYEAATSHNITVVATSSDGSTSNQTFSIALSDVNEAPVGAISDTNGATNTVAENASNGSTVGLTASATDADGTATVSYSLSDDAGGRFTINAATGVVTVANGSLLNYEAATSHNITVVATSSDGSTSNQTFSIALSDVNEAAIGAVSDVNAAANTVAENASNGSTVGLTASATDADGTATVSYSLSDDAGGRFTINAATGVVTVANGSLLNYEAATSHNITVVATSSDGSTSNQTFSIALNDVNEAPVGAVSDTNGAANTVAENASNGSTVGLTASATDSDGTATVSYSLSDDAGGRFTINAATGVVTVANGSLLNYETATSHSITVVATSSDGSTSNQTFSIALSDVNETPVGAVSDTNGATNTVAENASNGSTVAITASATDTDGTATVSYSLSDDAGGRFTINAATGVVTVANGSLLNYEAATSHSITVVATSSDGSTSNQTFSIAITDVNETPVGAVSDTNGATNAVAENASNGSTVGLTASATDADGTATVSYSLSDDAGGRFTINAATGVVTVANGSLLNYEAASSHNITVVATSSDGSTSNQTFSIALSDVNEAPVGAISDTNGATNTVAENASNGSTVGITASATDADGTATVSYSLSDDAGGRFTINAATGVITVANGSLLNYEAATSHNITVVATSSDGSTSNQTFSIALSDVNEAPVGAISDTNGAANTVAENASNGSTVGLTASATDADGTATVSYSLSDDAGGRFTINAATGVVTVANGSLLNYEAATSHNITVVATSSDGSTSNQTFSIAITDVNEAAIGAVSDVNAAANTVTENASNGSTVGITASATDADGTATVSYSLSDDAGGRFTINAATGVVTVANGSLLNYEAATSHNITVVATSSDGSTSNQTFSIAITDVNEAAIGAVSDVNAAANTVAENTSNGSTVGITASATDADGTATVSYSLSDDAGGRFTINAATGVVTVANGSLLNYEAATSHNITMVATSSDGSTSNQTFSIALSDVNEAAIGAVSDVNAATNTVAENASNGSTVGLTASATDADGTATVSYSLSDDAGGRFTINAATGVITVADGSLLNYEAATSHNITVVATSSDGSTSNQTFSIALSDVNETPVGAISDTNGATNTVAENASNDSTVGLSASATDADGTATVSYSLSDDAGGRFTINAATGVITVANGSLLNYEAATSHSITVVATSSDGSTSNQTFSIAITDVNEAAIGAVSDVNAAANTVTENASNGSTVGITASATDADGTATVSYSLSDDAGGRFTINAATGVVTVANDSLLNYEAATSHNITVVAASSDGSTSNQTFSIAITDVNETPVGAVSDTNAATNTVAENASNGSTVGLTVSATDTDAVDTVSYALSDDAGGRFTINAATGVVTVANGSLLNYEAATSHSITVVATSSDGSTSNQTFSIAITDVNETPVGAVSDTNAAANTVAENASNGSTVGITASATDADGTATVSYSLSDDAGGRFTINAATGVITVANGSLLNYEAATSHSITVVATSSDGSTSNQTFSIALSDVNEAAIGAVSDVNAAANTVAENASNGSTVGITASATDADGTATVSYSLSDDAGGRFTINAATGVVTVANGSLLNYEAATSHSITVVATSSDGSASSQTFSIALSDTNEAPVGAISDTNGATTNTVAENASNGSTVGLTASATDTDVVDTVSYALSDDAGGRFTINAATGVVTVANGSLLNYEAATSHSITVVATSSDGSTSNQTFSIAITDVNETPVGAVSDTNAATNTVDENASNGNTVGLTASATDADGTATVSYSLSDDAGGRFTINASTGVVTVANGSLLNYEAATSHNITVVATSSDGSTSNQAFSIALSDVNEAQVGAVSDTNAAANTVAENTSNGSTVGITASATDADGTATVSYSLSDDAGGRFTINAATGVVTVANGSLLNYEAATSYNITVVATSSDGSTSNQTFSIAITDVNEAPVGIVSDTNGAANTVAENTSNGSTVGITALATDTDGTDTVSYSLSDDASGRFTINAATGVITVANGSLLDYEAATSHNITVVATSSDGSTRGQTFAVALSNTNDNPPVIMIGDGQTATLPTPENSSNVGNITVQDPDGNSSVTYQIVGGNDAQWFAVNPVTGDLSFIGTPDYENPVDLNGDNRYEVVVEVSDGSFSQDIALQVNVQDQADMVASMPNLPSEEEPTASTPQSDPQKATDLPGDGNDSGREVLTPRDTGNKGNQGTSSAPGAVINVDSLQVMANAERPAAWLIRAESIWSSLDTGLATFSFENLTLNLAEVLQTPLPSAVDSMSFTGGFERMRLPDRVYFDVSPGGDEFTFNETSVRALKGSSIALTVGAVWWAARAGGLIASMVATTPAWRSIDPLPVLFSKDDAEDGAPLDDDADSETEKMFDVPQKHAFDPRAIT